MGSTFAIDLADSVSREEIDLHIAIEQHLAYNHYPPMPLSLTGCCVRAINYYNKGQYDKNVRLPDGFSYQGHKNAPIIEVIKWLNLSFFLHIDE